MADTDTKTEDETQTNNATESQTDSEMIQPFVLRWNRLISTTNWDKGEVIQAWRTALEESGAPAADFSDEKWSQLVGGVTPQHVGRLRRTFERFGHVYTEYKGLFWSHFYASLDWDDAEMWLEGAVQSEWSVSGMRHQRWETLGKDPKGEPNDDDVVVVESAEELQSLALADQTKDKRDIVEGPIYEGPDFGDEPTGKSSSGKDEYEDFDGEDDEESEKKKGPKVKPFEDFKNLPDDIQNAADEFKVCIIRHRADEWEEFAKEDMLGLLDAMKQLVTAN